MIAPAALLSLTCAPLFLAQLDAGPSAPPADAGAAPPTSTTATSADAGASPDPGPFSLATAGALQAVVVVTETWTSPIGSLRRFEVVGKKWMQIGAPMEVVVGETGLGWGLGMHPLGVGEPRKTEGDGRAPAGVFALSSAFGRGAPAFKTEMPWLQASAALACVDDPKSARYNRIVDAGAERELPHDYKTSEPLLRKDGLYDVAVLVDHNNLGDGDKRVIAGRGSCVFLHIWKKKGRGTNGCTAMARWDLEKVVEWLDPDKRPVLVQLPKSEWNRRRSLWGLP